MDGLPDGGGLNISYEAVDRHARGALAGHLAIRWIAKDERVLNFRYRDGRKTSFG
jgi:acetyl-CoA synthetase